MITVIRDYFLINKRSYKRYFLIISVLMLIGQLGVMLRLQFSGRFVQLVYANILMAVILISCSALFVGLVGLCDACIRARRIASAAGVPVDEYVKSEDYRSRGRDNLRRTDKEPKLW